LGGWNQLIMTAPTGKANEPAMPNSEDTDVLDPQVRELLQSMANEPSIAYDSLDPEQARQNYRESRQRLQVPPLGVAEVLELQAATAVGPLGMRLYKPFSLTGGPPGGVLPCLVYFHGGGFSLGDLDSHDGLCRALSHQGQCALVAVDYRLAPEHRFPAAVEDAIAAVRWVRSQAQSLGLDGSRMAVGGDSAGGALAAVTAMALRGEACAPAMQLLLYPITDMAHDLPSHHRFAQGYGLTRQSLLWFRANYLPDPSLVSDWRASPLRGEFAGLPPACVITAGFDPLLDEGRCYAERLLEAGVPLTYECFGGMIHGFALMTAHVAAARHVIYRAGQSLRAAFGITVPHLPALVRPPRSTQGTGA